MKDYLSKFRAQAFEGAFALFKRVLLPNLVLNLVMTVIFLAVFIPLVLSSFGWSAKHISEFNEKLMTISESGGKIADPDAVVKDLFVDFAFGFFILALVIGLIMFSWMYFTYLKLNDNEVRNRNNSVLHVLARSFSSRIWTIVAYILLFMLISVVVYLIYFQLVALLFDVSRFWGVLIAFFGFFVMIMFFMRFIIAIPAIVHGNMSVIRALKFSYHSITWKRSALLLLFGLVFMVILWIVMLLAGLILPMLIPSGSQDNSILSFIVFQIVFAIIGAAIGAFVYASLSALYFRYSHDQVEEDTGQHLVSNDL